MANGLIEFIEEDRRIRRYFGELLAEMKRGVVACAHRELRTDFPAEALEVE